MGNKKWKAKQPPGLKYKNRKIILLWVAAILLGIMFAGASVYGFIPAISLNSPTSFPIDI